MLTSAQYKDQPNDDYGSYSYLCVLSPNPDPFWCHRPVGRVVRVVTEQERAAMKERAQR